MGVMAEEINYNPFDPTFLVDPYPHYAPLLTGPPRCATIGFPAILVARYADVVTVVRDHARFSSVMPQYAIVAGADPFGAPTMPFSDPPVHSRLRTLVARDFSPRRIAALATRIREITCRLLDENAYGSNMNRGIFESRRGMRPIQARPAWLENYCLRFNLAIGPGERGVANLESQAGART